MLCFITSEVYELIKVNIEEKFDLFLRKWPRYFRIFQQMAKLQFKLSIQISKTS